MAYAEIEPWATKTLLLLRSSAETSMEEMRTMLMETIHQKYNGRKQYKMIPPLAGPTNESFEKNKSKESKTSSSDQKSKSHSSGGFSPSINLASPESYASDSDASSANSDMVILEDDLACAICKELTSAAWNQFVECAECHSLFHQQCHVPPIPDSDVSDPRTVWYCRNCMKTVSKPKTSSMSSSSTSSQSSKNSSSKPSTGRSNTSSPSFGSKPFGGVSMSSKKSSSSKNSQSSSNKVTPNLNMVTADKRLQIMKKKAARKQEKRPK